MHRTVLSTLAIAATTLALTACASGGSLKAGVAGEGSLLAEYEAVSGEPVGSFRFFRMVDYTALGDHAVAVWTEGRKAYLITVDEPCSQLRWATAINVTSSINRVHADFDRVAGCRIESIRPVDVAALRDRQRERAAQSAGAT